TSSRTRAAAGTRSSTPSTGRELSTPGREAAVRGGTDRWHWMRSTLADMPDAPNGTVTFLFTDIEGSTRLWEEHPDAMRLALGQHDSVLRAAIESNGGHVFKTMGDAFCAAFPTARAAVDAALVAQQNLVSAQRSTLHASLH